MSDTMADLLLVLGRAAELAVALGLVPESALLQMVIERLERVEFHAREVRHVEGRKENGDG